MERIRCTIEQVTFQNSENGYSVFQVSMCDDDDMLQKWQTIVGTFSEVSVGTTILADGEWRNDKRFGKQFAVSSWQEEMPSTIRGIEKYLGSGLINGIGTTMAKRIVKHFGVETMNIIDKTPERLTEVNGIGKDRMQKIKESWRKQRAIKDIMIFLQGHGVSSAYAVRIYKEYGKDSIQKVKENPYALADDVFGIGFKMADAIAFSLGYGKNDPRRCKAGIIYTLNQYSNDGHCYCERLQLIKLSFELLQTEERSVVSAMDSLITSGSVVLDGEAVFLPKYFFSECGVADKLCALLKEKDESLSADDIDIAAIEEQSGITYDDIQRDAIKEAVRSKVMVLTGGPGTGKTTTVLGIINAFENMDMEILCAAPTGRAAKRMKEATERNAQTIHRLLCYKPKDGFLHNEVCPLEGDVLIVDESSMIDISLMYSLLKAVPKNMRVILVGDIDQLPSVGAGNVLRDIIDSGVVPVVRLTRIFRQALTSRIVTNAHKINRGEMPDITNGKDADFFFIQQENADVAAQEVVNIVKNRIPKAYGYGVSDMQVLSPMKNGAVGTVSLNISLQEAINPIGDFVQSGQYKYRVGDKVMQIKNNYDKNVFNGDVGTVTEVNSDDGRISVVFDDIPLEYEKCDMHELTLAYACTIHKSQGSEYPVVVVPLLMSHYIMLQRNLVYTAVTRSKKICIIIGSKKALAYAIKNMVVLTRNTMLKERLRDERKRQAPCMQRDIFSDN